MPLPVALHISELRRRLMAAGRWVNFVSHLVIRISALRQRPTTQRAYHRVLIQFEGEHLILLALRPLRTLTIPAEKTPMRDP